MSPGYQLKYVYVYVSIYICTCICIHSPTVIHIHTHSNIQILLVLFLKQTTSQIQFHKRILKVDSYIYLVRAQSLGVPIPPHTFGNYKFWGSSLHREKQSEGRTGLKAEHGKEEMITHPRG